VVHTSQIALQHICKESYASLYTTRQGSPATKGAKFHSVRSIKDRLTTEMKAPLQLGELQAALGEMCTGKSPSLDGIVLEFYMEFWPFIG
jgi:hypothetical protein